MTRRPEPSSHIAREVLAGLAYELDSRASMRKNGETDGEYAKKLFWKLFTFQNMCALVVVIYVLGGNVNNAQRDLAEATRQAKDAAAMAAIASEKADVASRKVDAAAQSVEGVRQEVTTLRADVGGITQGQKDITDRLRQTVTRPEFKAAIEQRVLPAIERGPSEGPRR